MHSAQNKTEDRKSLGSGLASAHESTKKSTTLSFSDFLDPTKPWDLREGIADSPMKRLSSFVPTRFKEGPWSPIAIIGLIGIIFLSIFALYDANMRYTPSNGITQDFFLSNDRYQAYTLGWYYNIAGFFWMTGMMYAVYIYYSGFAAWVSFTLWSWTIITIRHGLCTIAPFVPSVRIMAEILRFPVLLSASITFVVWNFVLMPFILLYFLRDDPSRRSGFIKFAFGFRLCQLHIFNILFAGLNAAWIEPLRPLHVGDMNSAFCYVMTYIFFYYFILDRIGVQLYPIFSPRVPWVIFSWIMIVGACIGGYKFWNTILAL